MLLVSCSVPTLQPVPGADIMTESGEARGVTGDESVVRWLDIPYAQAPIGERRWRAPQAIEPTQVAVVPQVADIMCPQMPSETAGVYSEGPVGQEDCLYLDIVAPADFAERSYPVMFWIHGGGNTSGRKGTYDFSELAARQGVVVVTFNYRLGPLGWMTHSALQHTASGLDRSSNFGTLDILAALQWVHRNIDSFGGDVGNITLFGESAGGHNIYALLVSPLSEGLFHKAVVQSGYTTDVSLDQAVNHRREFARIGRGSWELQQALGMADEAVDAARLRDVPVRQLVEAYYGIEEDDLAPLTTADGIVIPEEGIAAALGNSAYAKQVPVLAGSNRDEVALWLGLSRYFVEGRNVSLGLLPPKMTVRNPLVYDHWVSLRSQGWKARGVDTPLRALESAGYPALFAYRFDWDDQEDNWLVPFADILGAAHGAEIAFVMGRPMYGSIGSYMYPDNPSAADMTEKMMRAWGHFAREGAPGPVGDEAWLPFSTEAPHTMVLDSADRHRLETEQVSLASVLQGASQPSSLSATERCLLVWELLINIGRPLYDQYPAWNNGECVDVDPRLEKDRIDAHLVRQYGSSTLP